MKSPVKILPLEEQVTEVLSRLGMDYFSCEKGNTLDIFSNTIRVSFKINSNTGKASTDPQSMALIAYRIQQAADIIILANPELSILLDYCNASARHDNAPLLHWAFTFTLKDTFHVLLTVNPMLYGMIARVDNNGRWKRGAIRQLLQWERLYRTGWVNDLDHAIQEFCSVPAVRFLMGIGGVLTKEEWAIRVY